MKRKLLIITVLLSIFSCKNIDLEKEKQSLLTVDKEFSDLSEKVGMHKAFLEYIDENGVLLKDKSMPVVGKENLANIYKLESDTGFVLTWEPLFADISKSCDFGYTYGIWTFTVDTLVEKGTYTTIWKKNNENQWKFVMDTGNDGLE